MYHLVDNNNLKKCIEDILNSGIISLDCETTGLTPRKDYIVGIGIATKNNAYYFPIRHIKNNIPVAMLYDLLHEIKNKNIIYHNAGFDWTMVYLEGIDLRIFSDTLIIASIINGNNRLKLESLAKLYLNRDRLDFKETFGGDANLAYWDAKDVYEYACDDVRDTYDLFYELENYWNEGDIKLRELELNKELNLIKDISKTKLYGIPFNKEELIKLGKKNSKQIIALEKNIYVQTGVEFNINSPEQVANILLTTYYVPKTKMHICKKSEKLQVNKKELQKLSYKYPICKDIVEYNSLVKENSLYVDGWLPKIQDDTGKIYTNIKQIGTETGRMSCTEPNLQQVKPDVRYIVEARDDNRLVSIDYSQIEVRILLANANSPVVQLVNEGYDVHRAVASFVFNKKTIDITDDERKACKSITFGIAYGQSAWALSQDLGISENEARDLQNKFYINTGVKNYIENTKKQIFINEFADTAGERRRYDSGVKSPLSNVSDAAIRSLFNFIIQGTAGEILKQGASNCYTYLKANPINNINVLLFIHDEILFEFPPEDRDIDYTFEIIKELQNEMETEYKGINITTEAKIGYDWLNMEVI